MRPLTCQLKLPADFRANDVLDFHRRDSQMLAERVGPVGFAKGLLWNGRPACLAIRFHPRSASVELTLDEPSSVADTARLGQLARHMLGLNQPVDAFIAAHHDHPQLGPLLATHPGRRVPQTATPFEALTWAITGQQISLGAAVAARRKLIRLAGTAQAGGPWCYPDAPSLAARHVEELRQAGFSQGKAETLIALSRQVADGTLPLDDWLARPALPVDEIRERLLAIRGIGPWTVDYGLLRGFGWVNGSLHGDAAVRRKLQHLLGSTEAVGERQAAAWLSEFSPWRALVAAHLWAMENQAPTARPPDSASQPRTTR